MVVDRGYDWRNKLRLGDDEESGSHGDQVAEEFKSDGKPTVCND